MCLIAPVACTCHFANPQDGSAGHHTSHSTCMSISIKLIVLQGDHWTYWTQQLAAEMLSMLAPGLGYNMQSSSWKDATGDTAEHIADAEAEDSIAYALRATQGPQQLLNLLEGSELVRYFCEKAPDMPAAHALLHESPSHAFATKLILAMWRDHQGNPKVKSLLHPTGLQCLIG